MSSLDKFEANRKKILSCFEGLKVCCGGLKIPTNQWKHGFFRSKSITLILFLYILYNIKLKFEENINLIEYIKRTRVYKNKYSLPL